jgi:hypothetical protein
MEGEPPICVCGLRMTRVALRVPGTEDWRAGWLCQNPACTVDPSEVPAAIEGIGIQQMPERPWAPGEEKS